MKALRRTDTHEQHLTLSAPATAALAIDESQIEVAQPGTLRLLLVGTKPLEFLDKGQWYRFLPAMLGLKTDISVTACGVDKSQLRRSRATSALLSHHRIRTYLETGSVSSVLAKVPFKFDIAIGFSSLEMGQALLDDLKALREAGTPFYLTSYSSTHALLNHAILRAHRAEATAVVASNPFSLVSKRNGENWNRVISKVPVQALPAADAALDQDYLDSLDVTAMMVLNAHRYGDPSQIWPVGAPLDNGLVHTLDGVCLKPGTGAVFDAESGSQIGTLKSQWHEVVALFDPEWDETDRLIWAAQIRYLVMVDGIAEQDYAMAGNS